MEESDIHGRIGDLIRLGTINSVDLAAATAVFRAGDLTSPPLPWLEWAGAFRSWSPPSAGEQVLLLCPEADIAAGVIVRGLYSSAAPAPASDASHQIHGAAGLVITLTEDGLTITAPGDVTIEGNVAITGHVSIEGDASVTGTMTAETDVVGASVSLKDHKHGGVAAGSALTGKPQ
ncbi:phage baseplate assembly protein V [Aurantiacibacter suaedae]|uniref:phage baseplate assembly protein V n=1 Tax=Aurantiacibacter suaedae TaxID=2545755 RepID=UPI0010F7F5CA|nr:phage baseplate assembly protein V [Aurantiacibacter suaedae]